MANFLDDLSTYNAKAALAISNAVAAGDTQKANMMNSLKSTANDTTLTEAVRLNALTALVNIGMLLDIPLPPYFPSVVTYDNAPVYQGIHNDLDGLQGGGPGEYFHLTQAQLNNLGNAATLADINFAQLGGIYTDNSGLATAISSKQNALQSNSGVHFVKINGTTISYDNSTYLTASTGIASGASFGGQVSGTYNALTLSNDAVIGKLLTNWNGSATYSAITASDSILSGMEKLNARISTIVANPGGVLNVKLATNASDVFTVTTSAQTGAATLNVNLSTKNKNLFLASSASTNATQPAFRAIENSDLPTSGVTQGSYGTTTKIPVIAVNNRGIVTSVTEVNAAAGGGQVDSVTMSVPSGTIYTANNPTPSAANITLGFSVQAQEPNKVYAGPSSGVTSVVPGFRSLVLADISGISIPQSQISGLSATLSTFMTNSLANSTMYVGNGSDAAVAGTVSGDLGMVYDDNNGTDEAVFTIQNGVVTYDKIQNVTSGKVLGRYSTNDGPPQHLSFDSTAFTLNTTSGVIGLQTPNPSLLTQKGDLLTRNASAPTRLEIGANATLFMADSAAATGNKWVAMSGDVTIDTSGVTAIGANKVTFAKMQTIANGTILGNNSGATAVPSALNATQVTALLNQFTSDGTGGNAGLKGLVPPGNITLPAGKTLADYVLTAAGSWVTAAGTGTVTGVSVATDNGFAGSATSTSTPVITIKLNNLSGMLKGNGSGVIQSATAGTDYVAPGVITQASGAGSGLTMASGSILGRTTASVGLIEAISVNSSLSLASTTLGINLGNTNIFTAQQQMTSIQLNGSTSGTFVSFTPPSNPGTQAYTLPTAFPTGGGTKYLTSNNSGTLTWDVPAGSGTTTNAVTFNNGGSGAASGTTFDGSAARTISYNTIGAQALNANLTGLSALTYTSGSPLVRMTGAGAFTLDGAAYVTGTATQYAVLVGGASNTVASVTGGAAGQVLRYVSGANPAWSTATYPNTTSINRILYSSSNNVVDEIVAPSDATFLRYTTAGGYSWQSAVTSLGFGTQGLITNSGTAAAPVLAVSGNSGGVVYFSNATTWASSGTLDQYELVVGGGAGSPPITINNSATAGTILTSNGNSNNPSWTAATYPTSTSINRILFSSANNVIDEIVAPNTANTFLKWDGTTFTWDTAGSGTVGSGTGGQLAVYTGSGSSTTVGGFTSTSSVIYSNSSGSAASLGFASGDAGKFLKVGPGGTSLMWDTAGSGSGTVNSGTQYRLAYYATTGTAVSEWNAITGSRALASDANGLPVASATTATELGYLSGVTGVTGTGNLVLSASPTFTGTPVLSTATATSINKVAITAPATSATLTLADTTTFTTSGAFNLTLTTTAATNATFPIGTITLVDLASSQALTGKTYNGLSLTANATGFSIAGGTTSKTLTISESLTLSASSSASVAFGAGGTVAYIGTSNSWTAGVKQTFAPNATNAGINVGSLASDPSAPANGDLVYNSSTNALRACINGGWVSLGGGVTTPVSVANGGTNGTATPTAGAIAYGTSTAYAFSAAGTVGQYLTSGGSGAPTWVNAPAATLTVGTSVINSGTIGRVLFQGASNFLQQSANLFWDNTNSRLSIGGSSTPSGQFQVAASTASVPHMVLTPGTAALTGTTDGMLSYATVSNNSSLYLTKLYAASTTLVTKLITLDRNPDFATGSGSGVVVADVNGTLTKSADLTALGIFSGTADGTTLSASGNADLLPTSVTGSKTLPANFFGVGKTIEVFVSGKITTTSNPGNLVLKLQLGATPTDIVTITLALHASMINAYWDAKFTIVCRTTGATGNISGNGVARMETDTGANIVYADAIVPTTLPTINTANAQDIKVNGAITVSNSVTIQNCHAIYLN